jgi:hypothetical protein
LHNPLQTHTYPCLIPSLRGGSDRTDKDGHVHHHGMPPLVRRLFDTDPPLLVRQLGKHRNLMRVVRYSSSTSEQRGLIFEPMFTTKLIDVGKDLCLGQVSENADALYSRMFLIVKRIGVFGMLVLNLFLFNHGGKREVLGESWGNLSSALPPIGFPTTCSLLFPLDRLICLPRNRPTPTCPLPADQFPEAARENRVRASCDVVSQPKASLTSDDIHHPHALPLPVLATIGISPWARGPL